MSDPRWIEFGDPHASRTGKTWVWVVTSRGGGVLGSVRWFGRWRKYSFFPAEGAVFEQVCLRDIADFCEQMTREKRDGMKPFGEGKR